MSNLPKLIGIHGHARAGKDTAAAFLVSTYKDHYTESFAEPLKDAASAAFGVYRGYFDSPDYKEVPVEGWEVSPRQIVQFMGTELFRHQIGGLLRGIANDFWVRRLERRLTNQFIPDEQGEYSPIDTVVIPDVRFQNEYEWILDNGGFIFHLVRPGADGNVGILGHASESSLDLHNKERTYEILNDGTIPELHRKIANAIISNQY